MKLSQPIPILLPIKKSVPHLGVFSGNMTILTEQIGSMAAPTCPRKRRGWSNFIGQGAKKFFGIASKDHTRGFRQAVHSNGEAIDKIARQANHLIKVVNALGSVTRRTMDEMKKILM